MHASTNVKDRMFTCSSWAGEGEVPLYADMCSSKASQNLYTKGNINNVRYTWSRHTCTQHVGIVNSTQKVALRKQKAVPVA